MASYETNLRQDTQAQEWARQQRLQEQQRSALERNQMTRLQQNNQYKPLFQRGQDNDMLYKTGFSGSSMDGWQQRVNMQVGNAKMEPVDSRKPSVVNNFGSTANAQAYDGQNIFQKHNPGGKPQEPNWQSLTPDSFTRYQLFYTKNSPYCKNFLHVLYQTPELDKEIQKIDVDELRQNGHKVEGLQGVPTIVDGQSLYLGKHALAWLSDKSSNRIQGVDIDDMGYSPIDQSGSQTAWTEATLPGNDYSYVFEDSQIQEFDARSLLAPQNATGRGAGSSLDQEFQRLKSMREQQIQIDRRGAPQQGGPPPQSPQQQQQYAPQPQQGYGQQGYGQQTQSFGRSAGVTVPSYNPNGPNAIQQPQQPGGFQSAAPSGFPPSGAGGSYPGAAAGGYAPSGAGGSYPGGGAGAGGSYPGGGSGYPQQGQQQLPSFLKAQDPRDPGPFQNRRGY